MVARRSLPRPHQLQQELPTRRLVPGSSPGGYAVVEALVVGTHTAFGPGTHAADAVLVVDGAAQQP